MRKFKTILLLRTAFASRMDAQLPTGSIIRFEGLTLDRCIDFEEMRRRFCSLQHFWILGSEPRSGAAKTKTGDEAHDRRL